MNKYLILFMFSLSAVAMEESGDNKGAKTGFLSDDAFASIMAILKKTPPKEEQSIQIANLLQSCQIPTPKGPRKRPAPKPLAGVQPLKKHKSELPEGVIIYRLQEVRKELPNGEKTGVLYISPSRKKNVIYCHFAIDHYWDNYVPKNDRIDVREVLKELNINARELGEKEKIHAVLLNVELKLRALFQDEGLVRSIIYAGLAEDFKHRSRGHGGDVVHANHKKIASKKVQFEQGHLADGSNLRMSYLIENIPKAYLEVFECLMAKLTFAFDFGASAKIGDKPSWKKIKEYWATNARIEAIKKSEFGFRIEELRTELRKQVIGFRSSTKESTSDCEQSSSEGEEEREDFDEKVEEESKEDRVCSGKKKRLAIEEIARSLKQEVLDSELWKSHAEEDEADDEEAEEVKEDEEHSSDDDSVNLSFSPSEDEEEVTVGKDGYSSSEEADEVEHPKSRKKLF